MIATVVPSILPKIAIPVGLESRNEAMQHYARLLNLVRPETDGKRGVFEEDIASFVGWRKQGTHFQN